MLTERIASGPGKPCHRVLVVSIFPRCPHVDPPAPHPPRVFVWWSLCTTRMLRHLTRRTSSYWKEEESRGRLRHSSRIKHYECHGQTFHLGFRVWQKKGMTKKGILTIFFTNNEGVTILYLIWGIWRFWRLQRTSRRYMHIVEFLPLMSNCNTSKHVWHRPEHEDA